MTAIRFQTQVAALETLVKVASGPEAGLLGSSWVIILRCLSLLEALQVRLKSIAGHVHQPFKLCPTKSAGELLMQLALPCLGT